MISSLRRVISFRTCGLALGLVLGLALALTGSAGAAKPALRLWKPDAFQSFVGSWQPDSKPLCAVLQSQDDWDKIFHPAPTMGRKGPFAPPPAFWSRSAMLVIARVIPASARPKALAFAGADRKADTLTIDYRFHSAPPASSTIKRWLGIGVGKPLPAKLVVKENHTAVCTLEPGTGHWIEPPQ